MADISRDLIEEVGEERAAQFAAHATQPIDSTTLLVAKLRTLRTLTADNDDLNTVIKLTLPD